MQCTYKKEKVTVVLVSTDETYALVTKAKNKKEKFFKVDLKDLEDLNKKGLSKLKKFKQ